MSRGRFAPSPTGNLHLGSARTALAAWLVARAGGGSFVLRMEDLDRPRVVPGAAERICEDLRWLGLDWDEGPDVGGIHAPYRQSERSALYGQALDRLSSLGLTYPCFCSRADVARAASAPHGPADDGPAYPGSCRDLPAEEVRKRLAERRPAALRFRVPEGEIAFVDGARGAVRNHPAKHGDFIVRRADGLYAYHLAVVADDVEMAIEQVVRGEDLLESTARQILLYRALSAAPPAFAHVPLVLGPDGQRLAKRHGSIAIRDVRQRGVAPEAVCGALAASLGLCGEGDRLRPADLVGGFGLDRVSHQPPRLDPSKWLSSP